jgi:YggT family protein
MYFFFDLLDNIFGLYFYVIVINVILSWLISLKIINISNQIVRIFYESSWRLTEPLFRRIRDLLPNLGGIDISPIIVTLIIVLLRNLLVEYGLVSRW